MSSARAGLVGKPANKARAPFRRFPATRFISKLHALMSALEIIGLTLAAAAAGVINAVAGGGTLITFPVLLFYGTPPVIANATSTLALVLGTAGSIFGFRGQIAAGRPWLSGLLPGGPLCGVLRSGVVPKPSNATLPQAMSLPYPLSPV